MTRINIQVAGFGLAAFLFLVAATAPWIGGGSLGAVWLVLAMLFFILAIAASRKARKPPSSPDA